MFDKVGIYRINNHTRISLYALDGSFAAVFARSVIPSPEMISESQYYIYTLK